MRYVIGYVQVGRHDRQILVEAHEAGTDIWQSFGSLYQCLLRFQQEGWELVDRTAIRLDERRNIRWEIAFQKGKCDESAMAVSSLRPEA